MQTDHLDHAPHLRLRPAHVEVLAGESQPARDEGEIEHQRAVRERELAQVHDDVPSGAQGAGHGRASAPLRGDVLVATADQQSLMFDIRNDDARTYTTGVATLKPMVTAEDVEDALSNVIDPELGLDFVELGLIYGVEVDAGHVHVTFTLTSPGCPIGPQVSEQIEEFVGELDDVDEVTSSMVFSPPWTPDKMSEDAKFALGF